MARSGKATPINSNVFEAALLRFEYMFDTFDNVAVSFSGGKDSTACLHLALTVATDKKRLPLRVFTFDEEAIPPETVEYMARIAARDDIAFEWYCVPVEHRNACSTDSPYWYCWAPEDRARWVRPLPELAITTPLTKKRVGIPDMIPKLYPRADGTVCNVMGIRTEESITRYQHIATKRGDRAFLIAAKSGPFAHVRNAYPIYDWRVEDIWLAPQLNGWDYNRAYDVMSMAGIPLRYQRCCPPFGDQPIRGLGRFASCWPELWARMVDRVPGAATAARYANTELYLPSGTQAELNEGQTWRERTLEAMDKLEPRARAEVAVAIRSCIRVHESRSSDPIPDAEPHPLSGYCWKFLYIPAKVGSDKFGRQSQKVWRLAVYERRKRGINS